MATPKTGAISFSDLNIELMQEGSTAQRSISSAGARMGYTAGSQVSMSDLTGCFGGTVTAGTFAGDKYMSTVDGYFDGYAGSVDDRVYTPGGYIKSIYEQYAENPNLTQIIISGDPTNLTTPPAGFYGTNINRVALADTTKSINTSATNGVDVVYNMPGSGTVTFGLRFS